MSVDMFTFNGLSSADFDAYLPEKWSSNMFTLQRRKVKEHLNAMAHALSDLFSQSDLPLIPHLSDDHPSLWNRKQVSCQWLFFSRDTGARQELQNLIDTEKTLAQTLEDPTPLYRHIFIGVSVDKDVFEISIRLHHDAWVDRQNLLKRLEDPAGRETFLSHCVALPPTFSLGLPDEDSVTVATLTPQHLQHFIEQYNQSGNAMYLGLRMDREQSIAEGPALIDRVTETARSLIPVFRFMAWSPENDAVSMDSIVARKQSERLVVHEALEHERQVREHQHSEEEERRHRELEDRRQEILDNQAWREQERAKRRAAFFARQPGTSADVVPGRTGEASRTEDHPADAAAADLRSPAPVPEPNRAASPTTPARHPHASHQGRSPERHGRPGTERKPGDAKNTTSSRVSAPVVSPERMKDIQVGDRIRVLAGFLKEREGTVQHIDEKGDLKVSFGMLSSRVDRKDVTGLGPSER